jgi:HAD superfamily hydrolase (TIGR01509 family)
MNKLVIFDMDGLLVDSEPLQLRSYIETFAQYGVEITHEEYIREWIQNGKNAYHYVEAYKLAENRDSEELVTEIRNKKRERYEVLIENELTLKPGAYELLEKLQGKIDMVIASSSRMESLEQIVDKFGIRDYFAAIFSDATAKRSKPFPDIFLDAAKKMEVKPSECVVIEDAEKGLSAAKAAGMKCVICPEKLAGDWDRSQASLVVGSLAELDLDIILNI